MKLFLVTVVCLTLVAVSESAPIENEREVDLERLSFALRVLKALTEENSAATTTKAAPTPAKPATTQPPPKPSTAKPETPQPALNQLTSLHLCSYAMDLYPPVDSPQTKRDLVVNMINYICLPSAGVDDLYAAAVLLHLMGQLPGYEGSFSQYVQAEGAGEADQNTDQGMAQALEEALAEAEEAFSPGEGGEEGGDHNEPAQQEDDTPTVQPEEANDPQDADATEVAENNPEENVEDTNDDDDDDDDDDEDKEEEEAGEQDANVRRAEQELKELLLQLETRRG
ncbi:uncharacterized protein [Diadema setosum]|uniref:uncharacterized protein n=1 Tax=Diadema setosum TaxID=31175 RepID=UPI003B3A17DA